MNKFVHPAVILTAGFFLILLLQFLDSFALYGTGLALLASGYVWARAGCVRILRRVRYFFIALFVLFAWQTPGTLVYPGLGVLSPSFEGLTLATEQSARLLGVAALVALLLHRLDISAWMSSLHVLLQPLMRIGFDPDRFVLRLRLVLDHVADQELDWRKALDSPNTGELSKPVVWQIMPLSLADKFLLLFLVLLFMGVLVWRG